jgi:hypothetical protein
MPFLSRVAGEVLYTEGKGLVGGGPESTSGHYVLFDSSRIFSSQKRASGEYLNQTSADLTF